MRIWNDKKLRILRIYENQGIQQLENLRPWELENLNILKFENRGFENRELDWKNAHFVYIGSGWTFADLLYGSRLQFIIVLVEFSFIENGSDESTGNPN